MKNFLLFINSFYLGLGSFFSFFIAPTLFRVLAREQAGSVVEKIFPVYFLVGLVVGLVSSLLLFKQDKVALLLAMLVFLTSAVELFFIVPYSHHLKQVDYERFLFWHGVSMVINLVNLLSSFGLCVRLMLK